MMADNGTNNSDNEQILAMPELNEPVGVPEWNEAMGMPEWDGAESSDSISVDSSDVRTFADTFNELVSTRLAEENEVISSVVEDYTLDADAAEAEVIDKNTSISEDIISQWKSREVIAPDGSKHDKQTLLKSIFLPDGMIIASSLNPLSMDRNSRVQGKSRHGANKKDEGTRVA